MNENVMKLLKKGCDISLLLQSDSNKSVYRKDIYCLPSMLTSIYECCNGLIACEGALLIRPLNPVVEIYDLEEWNRKPLWKDKYSFIDLAPVCFFAENAFGEQWGVIDDKIVFFDPETGELSLFAENIDDWAKIILDDYEYHTAWPLMHDWQVDNGAIGYGYRLIPIKPFVMEGEFAVDNLHSVKDVDGMLYRGDIAVQLYNSEHGDQNNT